MATNLEYLGNCLYLENLKSYYEILCNLGEKLYQVTECHWMRFPGCKNALKYVFG